MGFQRPHIGLSPKEYRKITLKNLLGHRARNRLIIIDFGPEGGFGQDPANREVGGPETKPES